MKYITIFLSTTFAAAIVYFSLVIFLFPALIPAEYWVREMLVIKRNIVKEYAGKKKIIIASGSSTLFGIDTKQLSDELKIPVINFGLHFGLPLKTILAEAEAATEKGDVVFLPLEPGYYCIKEPTQWQVRNAIAWDHEQWEGWFGIAFINAMVAVDPEMLSQMVKARFEEKFTPSSLVARLNTFNDLQILKKFSSSPEPLKFAYSAYNLDGLGNMKKIDGTKSFISNGLSADKKIEICPSSWNLLSSFTVKMADKGVSVYFANTPYVAGESIDKIKVEKTSNQFVTELSQLAPVLDRKPQLIFKKALFFNGDIHLNTEGRRLRTKILAESIRNNSILLAHIKSGQ